MKSQVTKFMYIFILTLLLLAPASSRAQDEITGDGPEVNIRFLFVMCNDIDEMRHFYTDLLQMKETSYMNEEDWGWLVYKCDGFEFMFFEGFDEMPVIEEWVWQPGWGGDIEGTSWSIEYPEDLFAPVVAGIIDDGEVDLFNELPEWRQDSYWGLTIKDPMGNSVEIYFTPSDHPESTEWPE